MKKRFSFIQTVIIVLVTVFLFLSAVIWTSETFNLPDWILPLSTMVAFFLFFEIAGHLGPKPFDTLITVFLELRVKDKVVLSIAILAFLIIGFPIASNFDLPWQKFSLLGVGYFLSWLICFLFGSQELRKQIALKRKTSTEQEEK